jgi:hypothetical protein
MKGNKVNFEKLIISEAQSIIEDDNLSIQLKEEYQGKSTDITQLNVEKDFEEVKSEEFAKESKKVKNLSEEVARMKELLNFNNPLLKG